MVANARLARMIDSVKYNPKFALSELAADFSAGEGAGYMLVFGNKTQKTARRDLVEYFFGMCCILEFGWTGADYRTVNEHLPTELGWTAPEEVISLDDLFSFSQEIYTATSYDALETKAVIMRRDGMVGKVL
jgi:hypothetical protein